MDSAWTSGWYTRAETTVKTGVISITSVGFVFSEDERQVVLCMSYDAQPGDAKRYDGCIAIPKVAITAMVTIGG